MEEPILSRLNRLDNILKQLDEIKSVCQCQSPKSSFASTNSSGALSWDVSVTDTHLEKHCRPVTEVLMEVEQKGTLIQRLIQAEDRIFKLCLQLEQEYEGERSSAKLEQHSPLSSYKKGGLKKLVKSCVGGQKSTKNPNTNKNNTHLHLINA